jgi:acyl-CoA reductase-like NAD-dependent aldehyde dehydrogenase
MTTAFAPHSINSKKFATKSRSKPLAYQSVMPFDGKRLETFKELTDPELKTAIKTAATCFETWRNTSFAKRGRQPGPAKP